MFCGRWLVPFIVVSILFGFSFYFYLVKFLYNLSGQWHWFHTHTLHLIDYRILNLVGCDLTVDRSKVRVASASSSCINFTGIALDQKVTQLSRFFFVNFLSQIFVTELWIGLKVGRWKDFHAIDTCWSMETTLTMQQSRKVWWKARKK